MWSVIDESFNNTVIEKHIYDVRDIAEKVNEYNRRVESVISSLNI